MFELNNLPTKNFSLRSPAWLAQSAERKLLVPAADTNRHSIGSMNDASVLGNESKRARISFRIRVALGPRQQFRLVGVGLSNFLDPQDIAAQPLLFG